MRVLSKRHDISRNLIRIWVEKYQAGALDEDILAVDLLEACEARIAALERLVGKQAVELECPKRGAAASTTAEKRDHIRHDRPEGIGAAQGCRLMDLPRSTFYDEPTCRSDDTAIVEAMAAICEEFEHYGRRRVRAALRAQGLIVNCKKIHRLKREHDGQP